MMRYSTRWNQFYSQCRGAYYRRSGNGNSSSAGVSSAAAAAAFTTTTGAASFMTVVQLLGQQPITKRYASSSATDATTKVAEKVVSAASASTSSSGTTKVAAASGGGGSGVGGGFMQWYEGHLQHSPVRTKMVTGGFLWGIGDAVAQIVPGLVSDKEQENENSEAGKATTMVPYDYARTARAVFFGFAIHAPASHVHFNFLEWMAIQGGFKGLSIPIFKTIMEQFVYWSWVSNSMYHGAMGAMQGQNLQQIYDRIADVLWETQKAQWVFWIPIQLLNFNFVPVRHQLNVVLLTSIAWTALLSAWYPPEPGKEGEDLPELMEEAYEDETKKLKKIT